MAALDVAKVIGSILNVGANEFFVNVVSTFSNLSFLQKVNKGKFDGVDFMKVLEKEEAPKQMFADLEAVEGFNKLDFETVM